MSNLLQIKHVSKSFGGVKVIDDISFDVPKGSIFGFIGVNGAGKTTTMKMALGLLRPDRGDFFVRGERVVFGQTATNRHIGYLPDVPEFYIYMRPKEYLKLCGSITGLSDDRIKSRSNELLALVGLKGVNKKIGGFSRGMKQRLGVAQALLGEPELLICDEPTSALDPVGRKEILDIVKQLRGKTTVIFSTHILSDVERICDRVAVIHKGKIALTGTLAELKARRRATGVMIEFVSPEQKQAFLTAAAGTLPLENVKQTETDLTLQTGELDQVHAAILQILAKENILPLRIEVLEPSVESLFMEALI